MPLPVIYITAIMLLIGAAPLPYGYYMLLRLVTTGVLLWAAYISYERKYEVLPWVFAVLALLFNPIFKVHFPKELWAIIDVVTGIFLLVMKDKIKEYNHRNI